MSDTITTLKLEKVAFWAGVILAMSGSACVGYSMATSMELEQRVKNAQLGTVPVDPVTGRAYSTLTMIDVRERQANARTWQLFPLFVSGTGLMIVRSISRRQGRRECVSSDHRTPE